MTLAEMFAIAREDLDDTATANPLYSDARLLFWANEAQMEACRRARLLVDATTADICTINVEAGDQVVTVDPRVIFIRRIKLGSHVFGKMCLSDLERIDPEWLGTDQGEPDVWVPDYETGKIAFNRPFDADGTLALVVVREPTTMALADPNASPTPLDEVGPEISPRYHYGLFYWIKFRAQMQRDVEEKYDPEIAKTSLKEFEREFGATSSAQNEAFIHRRHGYDEFEGLY